MEEIVEAVNTASAKIELRLRRLISWSEISKFPIRLFKELNTI